VVKLTVVTSRRVKNDQTQEWGDADVTYWDCTGFKTLAENCAGSLAKGMAVVATGRAVQDNWTDKEGQKRSKIVVKLDTIGPDLNRATARVEKANSQNQGGQQQRPAQQDPWASSQGQQQAQGGWGAPQGQQGSYDQSPPF
jgi:single-strand DNA-binding protein